jgi:hypothetical protein
VLALAAYGAVNGLKRAKHSHGYRPAAIVLDIEGTVAPISFVADVMFPYARDNVRTFLEANYDSAEARADVEAIRQQVRRVPGPGAFCVCCAVCQQRVVDTPQLLIAKHGQPSASVWAALVTDCHV